MAKGKSSASSATRKKQALKAAKKQNRVERDDDDDGSETAAAHEQLASAAAAAVKPLQPAQRGQKNKKVKKDRFAPKIKSYVAPPPPPKGQPDPVDLYLIGTSTAIDPELIVVLRKLAKKDEATIAKGIEALDQSIRDIIKLETSARKQQDDGDEDNDDDDQTWQTEQKVNELIDSMQVWAHHFPRLALHPSRRIRFLVHNLHSLLTSTPRISGSQQQSSTSTLIQQTRAALLAPLWIEQKEYTGAWCCTAFDADRQIRVTARRSWESVISTAAKENDESNDRLVLSDHASDILAFAAGIILTPFDEQAQQQQTDDSTLLKTQALLAMSYLVQTLPSPLPFDDNSLEFFKARELWDLLDPSLAGSSPPLRRAVYELLGSVVGRKEDVSLIESDTDGALPYVASKVLTFCWSEDEGWAGVIAFLRRYPSAWSLADAASDMRIKNDDDSSDEDDDESDDDDEDLQESGTATPVAVEASTEPTAENDVANWHPSRTISLLLSHLALGCTGTPSNYPTIILLLSTIPTDVLPRTRPALDVVFESFWAAYGARALATTNLGLISAGSRTPTEEFAAALLECLSFEASAMQKSSETGEAASFITFWIDRLAKSYLAVDSEIDGRTKRAKSLQTRQVAKMFEGTLARLAGRENDLFEAAWTAFSTNASHQLSLTIPTEILTASLPALNLALDAFTSSDSSVVSQRGHTLANESVKAAVRGIEQDVLEERTVPLLAFILGARTLTQQDEETQSSITLLASQRVPALLASTSTSTMALSLLTAHLSSTTLTGDARAGIWSTLFASTPSDAVLLSLVERAQEGELIGAGQLPAAGLDERVLTLAEQLLGSSPASESGLQMQIVKRLLSQPEPFVSPETPSRIVALIAERLPALATASLGESASSTILNQLLPPAELVAHYTQITPNASAIVSNGDALPLAIFEIAHLLPSSRLEETAALDMPYEAVLAAQLAWEHLVAAEGNQLLPKAVDRCRAGIVDTEIRCSPIELVEVVSTVLAESNQIQLQTVLPSSATFDTLFSSLNVKPVTASLSILQPLVSQSTEDAPPAYPADADAAALPPFVRAMLALLEVAARSDHSWIRSQLWSLPHTLFLADVARDELACSGSTSGVFGRAGVRPDVLERIVGACDGLSSYLISGIANALPEGWHAEAVKVLRAKEAGGQEGFVSVLDSLARRGRSASDPYARRAFSTVLQSTLRYSDASVTDAERWLAWAQNLDASPDLACAVIYAVKPFLLESPRFERYQNELASMVAGVPSSAAATKGLSLMRALIATAPPIDAPIIFLPQQRSMFLIQAIQKWISSDDDLPEEIHSRVAELFIHLAPIVQELSGSHWDLVFDVIESNLEIASWDEAVTLPAVFHSCRLLQTIKELAASNAELKATAKARTDKSLELVRNLFVRRPDSRMRDQPRIAILENMARLVRDLPPKLLSMGESFDSLLRLLKDPSLAVQRSTFDLVIRIAEKHVSDLVVEVELESEQPPTIALPDELMALLGDKLAVNLKDSAENYSKASTYILAWLVAFRFFEMASPRIKSVYNDQIRRAALIPDSFLPSIFGLLNLSDRTRVTDISPWAVDEFHLELADDVTPVTLPVIATFAYYRALQAVPSLIRQWWEGCKNRQLSMAVSTFTSKHFSPVLIAAELAHLRDPEDPAAQALRDNDDFVVKVAGGANEVKATFAIDEESMELSIRLPPEFPLQQVEIKDIRKVGVTDSQWRAWVLAVQQVITNQNGLIADALNIFKRNVVLHFEGVEPCAICYSSISVVDRTLPTKACKTCNNRFHSGCLFRWFSTSHGSSCPLCRSLF